MLRSLITSKKNFHFFVTSETRTSYLWVFERALYQLCYDGPTWGKNSGKNAPKKFGQALPPPPLQEMSKYKGMNKKCSKKFGQKCSQKIWASLTPPPPLQEMPKYKGMNKKCSQKCGQALTPPLPSGHARI